ncbi:hypothetical protein [Halomonas halocynthiae]|uniref:hypothetical protein n=1 Tax=Halomonas halocynthiae TaxID=176290 RepID=UPI000407BB5A|nr:hypothetical protein [Halomonas halocynthiae]
MSDDNPIKRWTAKGKTTAAEVARQYDLTVSEVKDWIDEAHLQVYALLQRRTATSVSGLCGTPSTPSISRVG